MRKITSSSLGLMLIVSISASADAITDSGQQVPYLSLWNGKVLLFSQGDPSEPVVRSRSEINEDADKIETTEIDLSVLMTFSDSDFSRRDWMASAFFDMEDLILEPGSRKGAIQDLYGTSRCWGCPLATRSNMDLRTKIRLRSSKRGWVTVSILSAPGKGALPEILFQERIPIQQLQKLRRVPSWHELFESPEP